MLKLRLYFGERDRDGDGPLEAAVMSACARHGVTAAALLRAVEGFGAKHRMRTDRLLTLSEDPPLVMVAVGEKGQVEALADEVREIAGDGLITLGSIGVWEKDGSVATTTTGTPTTTAAGVGVPVVGAPAGEGAADDRGEVMRVTVWGPRTGPRSPHLGAVAAFHRYGAEAAMVLLGVDGVLDGERRSARFVGSNYEVPAMTVAVGERAAIGAALADLDGSAPLVTVEGVETYRRIGTVSLHGTPATRVTYVTSEIERRGAHPAYLELIHALREQGAAGATALRGVWGFRGATPPHGDRVLALRRDVPILVEAIDAPGPAERWRELAGSFAGADDVVHSQPIERTILAAE